MGVVVLSSSCWLLDKTENEIQSRLMFWRSNAIPTQEHRRHLDVRTLKSWPGAVTAQSRHTRML